MTKEEKEAIEHLKQYPINWLFPDVNKMAIDKVINLIQKQDKEINNK